MDPICEGSVGAATEDIQERLTSLGYTIDQEELDTKLFGPSTATAVARFRIEHDLILGSSVDSATWSCLVDETYTLGDRTLYLRLPNFHGADVRDLQTRLNILGFSCGEADGYFGAYTETAVKQFQENVGLLADGMAFQETFDAIGRLKHVWAGTPAAGPHPTDGMGFARAANVLETTQICITAEDPISRNVVGRMQNLAKATTEAAAFDIIDNAQDAHGDVFLIIGTKSVAVESKVSNVMVDDPETLPQRIRTARISSQEKMATIRLQLPCGESYHETFTTSDAQMFAVILLDTLCSAFDDLQA